MSVTHSGKAAGLAALLGLAGLAAVATPASAHYTTERCDRDGDRCWLVRCDDDGDDCHTVRSYVRDEYRPRPRWQCDWDGDDCGWVYPRGYDGRPRLGFRFGWHD